MGKTVVLSRAAMRHWPGRAVVGDAAVTVFWREVGTVRFGERRRGSGDPIRSPFLFFFCREEPSTKQSLSAIRQPDSVTLGRAHGRQPPADEGLGARGSSQAPRVFA